LKNNKNTGNQLFLQPLPVTVPFIKTRTQKFKTQLTIAFFAAFSHNYGKIQRTLKKETNKIERK
jgi:hypothetical protein